MRFMAIAVLVASHVVAPLASAVTLHAPFDGPALPPSLTPLLPPGFSLTVGEGALRVDFADDGSSGERNDSGGLRWNLAVAGDFRFRATADVVGMRDTIGAGSFMGGGTYLGFPDGAAFVGVWRAGAGAEANGAIFTPSYTGSVPIQIPGYRVDIMIDREGDRIRQFAAEAGTGQWNQVFDVAGPAFLGAMDPFLDLYFGGNGPASGYITFTQVSVEAAAVPEPATLAMLLAGLAPLGRWTLRKRRDQSIK